MTFDTLPKEVQKLLLGRANRYLKQMGYTYKLERYLAKTAYLAAATEEYHRNSIRQRVDQYLRGTQLSISVTA